MCPEAERSTRERLHDIAGPERLEGQPYRTSRELAVKKFCRTFSGISVSPSDIRPLPVLERTMQHLLGIMDDHRYPLAETYAFLCDRMRAVRFHILAGFELRGAHVQHFDAHLNLQQLSKSLCSLLNLYTTEIDNEDPASAPGAEFFAYYVLLNMGSSADMEVPTSGSCRSGDYCHFFKLLQTATHLEACLLHHQVDLMRLIALRVISTAGSKDHPYPLLDLAKLLVLQYGLHVDKDESSGSRALFVSKARLVVTEKAPSFGCNFLVVEHGLHSSASLGYFAALL
eukprot:SM000237S08131  [mRNA]  locus=s237:23706:26561:+ [translate_table: standard]